MVKKQKERDASGPEITNKQPRTWSYRSRKERVPGLLARKKGGRAKKIGREKREEDMGRRRFCHES